MALSESDKKELLSIKLAPVRGTILRALIAAPDGLTAWQIAGEVYGGARKPKDPQGSIQTHLHYLRLLLALHGWSITKGTGGNGEPPTFHRLVRISG